MSELCGAHAFWCTCRDSAGHEGPHTCECGGSWTGNVGEDFQTVKLPDLSWRER